MQPDYHIDDVSSLISPALIVFRELVAANIDQMISIARTASRLRPHCKTHKMREVARMQLQRGIARHKAATFAEAEMLAQAGARDVFLAYNIVGPNIQRTVAFRRAYPDVRLQVTGDHPRPVSQLGEAMQAAGLTVDVVLDLNVGRDRTGLVPGNEAAVLYAQIARTPGLASGGLHVYDGHQHQSDPAERRAAVRKEWEHVARFRDTLVAAGLNVPRIVCGGTPQFPIYAELDDESVELSPGTCVFHDCGYGERFPDLCGFRPAALVLTRVISRPTSHRVTFDVGTKGIASDPPMGQRLLLPDIPDAVQVLHNEEHLVVETADADRWSPGDWTLAIPRHVCPTTALYSQAHVVADGRVVETWDVAARDRRLTI